MNYQILHNPDAGFSRPYRPGDRLIAGYRGTLEGSSAGAAAAEKVFARHNRGDRPDGADAPSLSVGDVVCFGEGDCWTVAEFGFQQVIGPVSVVLPGPYRETIRTLDRR